MQYSTDQLAAVVDQLGAQFPELAEDPVMAESLADNVTSMIGEAHARYAVGAGSGIVSDAFLDPDHLATGALHAEQSLHPAGAMLAAEMLFDAYLPVFVDEVGAVETPDVLRAARALHAGIWNRFPAGAIAYTEALRQRASSAHMDSRAQIARDLHDRIAHSILAGVQRVDLALLAETAPDTAADASAATGSAADTTAADASAAHGTAARGGGADAGTADRHAQLEDAAKLLRGALGELQDLAVALRARVGDDRLDDALARHLTDLFPEDAAVSITSTGTPVPIPSWKSEEALTILLEALTNWRKHAPDSTATVTFAWSPRTLTVTVSDDGPGFDDTEERRGRLGRRTMLERAAVIGARCTVTSRPGAGTTVELSVPIGAL
ncbi:sensor histidine kinase [Curtobacterium sp. NPDC098951]|uniref:sensor histidine kinase n=1 Tax=Curtobacterium sp. NPDC098951 TaxID=3363974 RepID=UPI00382CF8C2